MPMAAEHAEEILVAAAGDRGVLGGQDRIWNRVDLGVLRDNLRDLLNGVEASLPEDDNSKSSFRMTEISVAVTVGAKGQVGLLGTGAEASGQASLTVKLTRG
jgi:hypothetical protein